MPVPLSDKYVRAFSSEKRQTWVADTLIRGLYLRATDKGTKTWYCRHMGRAIRIGQYPQWSLSAAREEAASLIRAIDRGDDPRPNLLFGELAKRYLSEYSVPNHSPEWAKEIRRTLDKDLLPRLEDVGAAKVTPQTVADVVATLLERSPTAGRRARQVLSGLYAWAVERALVAASPVKGAPVPKVGERERVLSEGELRQLVPELVSRDGTFARILLLTLLTAQRPGYVAGMRWDAIDGQWWTVHTKRGKRYRVWLSDMAMGLVRPEITARGHTGRHARGRTPNAAASTCDSRRKASYVFPARLGAKSPHYGLESIHTSIRKLRAHLGLEHWTPHDLRRSAATWMARIQIADPFLISRILGHTDPRGVTAIYDRASYEDQVRGALERWGEWVSHLGPR